MTAKIDKGDHDIADPSGIKLNKGEGCFVSKTATVSAG